MHLYGPGDAQLVNSLPIPELHDAYIKIRIGLGILRDMLTAACKL